MNAKYHLLILISICINLNLFAQERKADINLLDAAYEGDELKLIQALKDSANINAKSYDGLTALMYASQEGYEDIVNILLHNGADPNINNTNTSALSLACEQNHENIVDLLCRYHADVNFKNPGNSVPLHIAAAYGYYITTDMLLFYGANIHIKDNDSNNALILASYTGQSHVIRLLLEHGADANTTDKKGFTPLMIAAQQGYGDIVSLLILCKAQLNKRNEDGRDALCLAVRNEHYAVLDTLLQYTDLVSYQNAPLLFTVAIMTENIPITKKLQKSGFKKIFKPIFNKTIISYNHEFSGDDIHYQVSAGLFDANHKLELNASFRSRYKVRPVLTEISSNEFYQVQEHRYMIGLNQSKKIQLHTKETNKYGIEMGISEFISFGNYRGMKQKPQTEFTPVFYGGFYWDHRFIGTRIGYEYLDTKIYGFSKHWFSIGLNAQIKNRSLFIEEKQINWLK